MSSRANSPMDPSTPVFLAGIGELQRARKLLLSHGIHARHSRPRKEAGILRVEPGDAERARSILTRPGGPQGRVVAAAEAAFARCPFCGVTLSLGQRWCPSCDEFVGP